MIYDLRFVIYDLWGCNIASPLQWVDNIASLVVLWRTLHATSLRWGVNDSIL